MKMARLFDFISLTVLSTVIVASPLGSSAAITPKAAAKSVAKPVAKVATPAAPQTEEEKIIALIKRSLPSVVSITGSEPATNGGQRVVLRGTGFMIGADGLIATNRHVVSDEKLTYTVYLSDGRRFRAAVVGRDPLNDISLIKIPGEKFATLPLANSDTVQIGQIAVAIGNSLGRYANTVTKGIISGLGRSLSANDEQTGKSENLDDVLQTDAAINPGNSGGPLLNSKGEVMGINTAIDSQGRGVGFAIPSNEVKKAVDSYRKNGRIVRPYVGIRYVMITPDIQDERGLAYDYGAIITRTPDNQGTPVLPGSPAAEAGLQEHDIILAVDGQLIRGARTLLKVVQQHQPGDTLKLTVARAGGNIEVSVALAEVPKTGL